MLVQRCINVIQMFCVCWAGYQIAFPIHLQLWMIRATHNLKLENNTQFCDIRVQINYLTGLKFKK